MPKTTVTFGVISKRQSAVNSVSKSNLVNESNAIEKAYRVITSKLDNKQNINGSLNLIKSNAERMLESLADSTTANKYNSYIISIIEKMNETGEKAYLEYADQLSRKFASNILQYISELDMVIENVTDYKLTDKQKGTILKEANIYSACDRIVNNYNTIKKRFNLEDTVLKNKGNLQLATEAVCSMIDTYNRNPYQKMNICIEEIMYIIEKNNLKCKKSDIVNTILEYFLLSSPELSDTVYNGYKKCITESCFINEEDISQIKHLFKRDVDHAQTSNIREYIDRYYISLAKTVESFEETVINCINSDLLDITYNFDPILEFLIAVYKSDNLINDTDLELSMQKLEPIIASRIVNLVNDAELSQELLSSLISNLIDRANEIKYSDEMYPRLGMLYEHFKNIIAAIAPYIDFLYDDANIQTISRLSEAKEVPLSEGHIFRGHNLLVAVRNLDRYLGSKCQDAVRKLIGKPKDGSKSIRDKISNFFYKDEDKWLSKKLKKGKENFKNMVDSVAALFASFDFSSFNAYSYITEESQMFDMTIYTEEYDSDEDIADLKESMSNLCKDFNRILESNYETETFKTYYIINAGEASIHFTENAKFILDEEAITKINEAEHPDLLHSIELLSEAYASAELVDTINNKDIETSLFSYFSSGNDMSLNKFDTILEALSLLEVDKTVVKKFANKYSSHLYYTITEDAQLDYQNSKIDELLDKYQPEEDVPSDTKLEAYLLFDALLEASDEDNDDEDIEEDDRQDVQSTSKQQNSQSNDKKPSPEEKEKIKKNPFKGINLKSIKLAILGLKRKFSQMSQKEKELSKKVDSAFKHMVDSFKNALISDSREQIIKGSVLPSFSKCLKIGIPAAIGISAGVINPGVAAIVALGSFALSKHVTNKERMLILDEIETELEVVEKEIQVAEREEDMKRYRALLQYKKNLQRQYQRIRYNVKLGKMPKADAGRPSDHGNDY